MSRKAVRPKFDFIWNVRLMVAYEAPCPQNPYMFMADEWAISISNAEYVDMDIEYHGHDFNLQ